MLLDEMTRFARRATIWDVGLRTLVLSAPLAVLGLAAALASTGVPGLLVVLIVAGAVGSAALPGSHAAGAELVLLAWAWLASVPAGIDGGTLVAALCVLLFHTSSLLAAAAPAGGRPERPLLTAVARRAGGVSVAVVGVWALAAQFEQGSPPGNAAVYSAALGAVGVLGLGLLLASRSDGSRQDR